MNSGFLGFGRLDDPYPAYARLRDAAPAVQVASGTFAVGRYDDVMAVLKNTAVFSSAPLAFGFGARTVIGADPPEHTVLRNTVNRAFTPRMVAAMEPRIREIARGLIDDFVAGGECDLIGDFAVPLPVIVIAEILGVDPERRDDFKRWSDSLVFSGAMSGALDDSREEFRAYFGEVIEQRRREPREDLISALTRAEEADTLTPAEVMSFAMLLLIAGNETTTNLIGNAMLALLDHPEQLDRVRREPAFVPSMVEEALRFQSPVQLIVRGCVRDTEVGGTPVPRGATVLPLFASANRDERHFAEPDVFDVTRDNARDHVAFGYGPHFCLGAPLARLEAQVAFEELLPRLANIAKPEGSVEWLPSPLIRGPRELRLRFKPAVPA
jgi:cytochrome P450